jgi:hypothetical protein
MKKIYKAGSNTFKPLNKPLKSFKPQFKEEVDFKIDPKNSKELSYEEFNLLIYGKRDYQPGMKPIERDSTSSINIDKVLHEENQKEIMQHGDLLLKNEQNLSNYNKINENNLELENISKTPIQTPKVPIHPKDIPTLKLEKIHSYDTIQLVESLRFIEFKKQNLNKFINILSVIRKKRDMKIYDFPVILNIISYIRNNIDEVTPSYKVSFLYSLSKIQSFKEDKPSLNNQTLVLEVLSNLMQNINSIDIRGISNLVYALQSFQIKNPTIYNFDEFLTQLEEPIIQKISQYRKSLTTQDVSNIVLAYCKTQNGSEEFYRLIQDLVISMQKNLSTQDIAVILYSYSNNPTTNEKLLENLEELVLKNLHQFKPKELVSILRAYYMRKLLNDNLKSKFISGFVEKHELTNALDLAHIYTILSDSNNVDTPLGKKFLKYTNQCLSNLYFTFTGYELGVIMEKAEYMQSYQPDIYELMKKQVSKMIKKGEFKGHDLKQIYENVKELPFEGKYNTWVEEIEKHLQKLRYY